MRPYTTVSTFIFLLCGVSSTASRLIKVTLRSISFCIEDYNFLSIERIPLQEQNVEIKNEIARTVFPLFRLKNAHRYESNAKRPQRT